MPIEFAINRMPREQIKALAEQMAAWENALRVSPEGREELLKQFVAYDPELSLEGVTFCGIDGTGEYPVLAYSDSFVYATKVHATVYVARGRLGLAQVPDGKEQLFNVAWLPEAPASLRETRLDAAFEEMLGEKLISVIEESDYSEIKRGLLGKRLTTGEVLRHLIRPHAHDTSNIGIQLRSVGELCALIRILKSDNRPDYVFMDGTLSLPMVSRDKLSLFQEHLKRLCCVRARGSGVSVIWLSKSHGLPGMSEIDRLASSALGRQPAENWFLRLSDSAVKACLSSVEDRNIPPPGCVTYLWKTHRRSPTYRVDLDEVWWARHIAGATQGQHSAEVELFSRLDYACHDMRCFGYPYPVKAAHDEAHWTKQDRVALRKQVIDAAVKAGLRRSAFVDPSQLTGHA